MISFKYGLASILATFLTKTVLAVAGIGYVAIVLVLTAGAVWYFFIRDDSTYSGEWVLGHTIAANPHEGHYKGGFHTLWELIPHFLCCPPAEDPKMYPHKKGDDLESVAREEIKKYGYPPELKDANPDFFDNGMPTKFLLNEASKHGVPVTLRNENGLPRITMYDYFQLYIDLVKLSIFPDTLKQIFPDTLKQSISENMQTNVSWEYNNETYTGSSIELEKLMQLTNQEILFRTADRTDGSVRSIWTFWNIYISPWTFTFIPRNLVICFFCIFFSLVAGIDLDLTVVATLYYYFFISYTPKTYEFVRCKIPDDFLEHGTKSKIVKFHGIL